MHNRIVIVAAIGWMMASVGKALPSDARSWPVRGTVVDANGQAVEGADVWLTSTEIVADVVIYSQSKSDSRGEFQLSVPDHWLGWNASVRQELGLIGYRKGAGLAALGFDRHSLPPASGIRLVLGPSEKTVIQVLAPDGKAVAGAEVVVTSLQTDAVQTISEEEARKMTTDEKRRVRAYPWGSAIRRMHAVLPEVLSKSLATTSDASGHAVFPSIARRQIGGIAVTARGFGRQTFGLDVWQQHPLAEFAETVTLRPVGTLWGRLVAENREGSNGIGVRVSSRGNGKPSPLFAFGEADVVTDGEGHFRVSALPEGALTVRIAPAKGSGLRAEIPTSLPGIKAGQRTDIEIRLKRAIPAKGVVREQGTGKPIPGMTILIALGDMPNSEYLRTDENGSYRCLVLPGTVYRELNIPRGFLEPPLDRRLDMMQLSVPDGAKAYEFPAVDLVPAALVQGTVISQDHQPVAKAAVRALQFAYNRLKGVPQMNEVRTTSDINGRFSIEGLDSGSEFRLEATARDACAVLVARPGGRDTVALQLRRSELVALRGRVRDGAGRAVAGAVVEIWTKPWMPSQIARTPELLKLNGQAHLVTDTEGRFHTPRNLLRDGEYLAAVRAEGFTAASTEWVVPARAKTEVFWDVELTPVSAVRGRILDRQGRPVSGARAFGYSSGAKRAEATSDTRGRFCLEGLLEQKPLVFVEKEGYRFLGRVVVDKLVEQGLTLSRREEPPQRMLATLPLSLSREERLALARRLIEPAVQAALASKNVDSKVRPLQVLARIDPDRVLHMLDAKTVEHPMLDPMLRRLVVLRYAKENPNEARAVAESISDPGFRSMVYLDLCEAASDSAQKQDLLGQAVVQARAVKEPEHRLGSLGRIAGRLFALGRNDQAVKILREGQVIAKQLPTSGFAGYVRGAFAEELAAIDLPAALELTKDLKDELEFNRHHGNIAHGLAGRNPAEAERVLDMIRKRSNWDRDRDQYAVRVCYRMASVDLPRSRRIAASLQEPYYRAQAYGVMAQALAKSHPDVATGLLGGALDGLDELVQSGKDKFNGFHDASCVAATLLPIAEQIDPRLVDEFLWRAVSLRQPASERRAGSPPGDEFTSVMAQQRDVHLAVMLARYDRALAEMIFDEVWKQTPKDMLTQTRSMLTVAAILTPKKAAAVVEEISEPRQNLETRWRVAKALALDQQDCWERLQREVLNMWVVDDQDSGPVD